MSTTKRKPIELPPGHMLQNGGFRIIKSLGRGGYGITYLAEQTDLEISVCIKEFYIDSMGHRGDDGCSFVPHNDEQAEVLAHYREKFLKEARTLARLEKHNNPNIVRVRSCFEENGTAYYAMEFVDGRSLADICNDNVTAGVQGAMSEADALRYIGDVANALKTIHSADTLHLDVKPSNIMVRDGRAVLIDFGISKHYDKKGRPTTTSMIGVSPGFSPLEQYCSDGSSLTSATDIYALAATLYTLVVGDIPPVAADVKRGGLPLLDGRNLSQSTIEAIRKSMSSDAEHRPQSIDEFLSLLDAKPTPHPVLVTIPKPESKTAPRVEPKPAETPKTPKPEPTPVQPSKPEPKPAPRVEPKPAETPKTPKPELTPVQPSKPEPKPAPRVEPTPEQKPAPRVEPTPVQTPKPAETPKAPTPAPKKSSKVWLWIVLALLLVGCGIGGWLIYDQNQEKARIETEQQRIAEQKAQEEAARIAEEKRIAEQKAEQQRIDNMVAQGLGRDGVYQVGDYYNRDGKQGVVFEVWNGGHNGKIVSLDQAEKPWCTVSQFKEKIVTGAKSETDGKANTDRIMRRSDSSQYPAFVWCRDKGDGWYLPAIDELKAIYNAKDKINNTMSKCGGESIGTTTEWPKYWTSTEDSTYDTLCARYVAMNDGYTSNLSKNNYGYVRAVSAF